jgi:beta-N-acetylhexosaminidase
MTDRGELAGGVLMVGLPGAGLDEQTRDRIRSLRPTGVILFGRNLETPDQTRELLRDLCPLLPDPPLFALDQEGGRVSRLEPWIGPTPSADALARSGEVAARRLGETTAHALLALGFNLDFAPVVDLCPPDAVNGIGDRSFGTDAARVAALAGSFLDGLQDCGVAGCLKHFPGLGDTRVDSHVELPTVERELDRLEAEDLLPYRLLGSRSACIMVGHGHYTAFDPDEQLPATCSTQTIDGLLRGEMGYDGLVVSDDLEMGAVAARDTGGAAAVAALRAGCDLLLYCSDLDRAAAAHRAIVAAAERDEVVGRRLQQAHRAVRRTAERWSRPPGQLWSWDRARAAFEEIATDRPT